MVETDPGAGVAWTEHRNAADPGTPQGRKDPPLVYVHGAGGSRLSWPPALRRMAGARVFALDLPGHGQAPPPPRATIGGYAEAVLDWLRQQDLGPALLVGHSMGAAIGLTVATRQESLLAGLVLVGLGPRLRVDPDLLELTSSPATTARAVDWVIERGFAPGTPEERLSEARAQMIQISPDVLRRDFIACDRFEASGHVNSIQVPVLIVCGSLDGLTPPEECRRLAEAIPQARFHLLPGAGHMVPIERPEEFASLIHEFMGQLR